MSLTVDASKCLRGLKKLGNIPKASGRRIMGRYALYLEHEINARAVRGLSGSFHSKYDAATAVVGSRLPWARIAHYGGKIRPSGSWLYRAPKPPLPNRKGRLSEVTGKPIKHLAIPIHPAAKHKQPRDFQNLVYVSPIGKRKGKHPLLIQKIGATGFAIKSGATTRMQRPRKGERQRGYRVLFVLVDMVKV